MKKVLLSNYPKYFIVDDEDYESVIYYNWRLGGRDNNVIQGTVNGKDINIGRFILGPSNLSQIDHKDRNVFNNRRSNLRNATHSQNTANKVILDSNTSGYKGVSSYKYKGVQKWQAYIHFNNGKIHLGVFSNILNAAKAYNMAAIKYFGEFACLNILPESEDPVK